MNLIDVNVLLYAYNEDAPHHTPARRWLEATLSGADPVFLAWTTLIAFVRIGTDARAFPRPMPAATACQIVAAWLELPTVHMAEPTAEHWAVVTELIAVGQARGRIISDVHLAALSQEHDLTLCTHDRDFLRFPGVRVFFPLDPEA